MLLMRLVLRLVPLAVLSVLVMGCSTASPSAGLQSSSLSAETSDAGPQLSPLSGPTPTPVPVPEPIQLVVLHTNDNWGETEPCG